jgi:hypothetical protein
MLTSLLKLKYNHYHVYFYVIFHDDDVNLFHLSVTCLHKFKNIFSIYYSNVPPYSLRLSFILFNFIPQFPIYQVLFIHRALPILLIYRKLVLDLYHFLNYYYYYCLNYNFILSRLFHYLNHLDFVIIHYQYLFL